LLVASNLKKHFGSTVALDGVDCTVEPGRLTAIIGPSGSGKSTLLRALSLIDPPDSGQIELDGKTYNFPEDRLSWEPPWPRLTVVFQQLFLWPHLTLRENILLPIRRRRILDAEGKLDRLLTTFNMAGFIDRYPNETSQGQRQRAALARAFLLEPAYILLDEVTSSLDVESVAAVLDHLSMLRREGIGLLLITHALGFLQQSADYIGFLDGGRTLEWGGKEILENPEHPRFKRFVGLVQRAT
jgi:ABC-type polar amino acid transport system ATPase subunit